MGASKVLGILGIIFAFFVPLVGLILGIIGISVKKEKRDRDIILNVLAIGLSVLMWFLTFVFLMGMLSTF
jgi:hypothetical protein